LGLLTASYINFDTLVFFFNRLANSNWSIPAFPFQIRTAQPEDLTGLAEIVADSFLRMESWVGLTHCCAWESTKIYGIDSARLRRITSVWLLTIVLSGQQELPQRCW